MTNARTGPPEKPGASEMRNQASTPYASCSPGCARRKGRVAPDCTVSQKRGCAEHLRCLPPRVEG
eukprot:15064451-Alexandrium_andersonii.AAC.1